MKAYIRTKRKSRPPSAGSSRGASGGPSGRTSSGATSAGGAYSFLACRSPLTIDHASPSRRSTDPITNTNTFKTWRSLRFFHMFNRSVLHISTPSCFVVCGHHLSLTIAIVTSLISIKSVPTFPMPRSSISLMSNLSRSYLYISQSPTMQLLLSTASPQGHTGASSSSPRILA